ncbi:MAG: lytic transglycosylase domain-containing protein [Magnetococcales bacterium]|nr:lytic transglycosylase domain-containing protein [Magnetococcales bacterium]
MSAETTVAREETVGGTPWWLALALAACLGAVALPGRADIYAYIDHDGVIHLTDQPDDPRFRLLLRFPNRATVVTPGGTPRMRPGNPRLYSQAIVAAASRYDLDEALVRAVIQAESSFDPQAVSPKGAVGLMQLMPEVAKQYGVSDRRDPEDNIDAGSRYLRDLLRRFDYNLMLSLAAYNAGEATVRRYGNRVPPYPETRDYVARVLRFYRQYRKM